MEWGGLIGLIVSLFALAISVLRNRWMAKQLQLNSAISIINWLEEVRPDRLKLYKTREEKRAFAAWTADEKESANRITRRLDILGLLDSLRYVDRRLVDRFYAIPAFEIWEICADWIRELQSTRGPQHLWEFQKLAERVKHVRDNHPARRKVAHWTRNPRKERKA